MNRSLLLSGVMTAALVAHARADDLTISTTTSNAVSTATAANNTPGNVTITSSGAVNVSLVGPAVTLNSNNFILNSGTITNSVGNQAVGISVLAGNSGGVTNAGTIHIPGTGTGPNSTFQFGLQLSGNGTFTGDIVTTPTSTVTVSGDTVMGVAIQSSLNGNLALGGNLTSSGHAAVGVSVTAPVSGTLITTGSLSTATTGTSTLQVNSPPGSALNVGSSIGGGILIAGPATTADMTAQASVTTSGSSAAMMISPGLTGTNMTLGVFSDATDSGYSLLNRGVISNVGTQPGVSSLALQIGETAGTLNGLTTTFTGGFLNRGTISATATSDNAKATSVVPTVSNATALYIGEGANIPLLTNKAEGNISAITGGPLGGAAQALVTQPGANLAAIDNAGMIVASATATDTTNGVLQAYGIRDLSGKLTSLNNTGTISATVSAVTGASFTNLAVDVSHGANATVFTNSGTVIGNVLFGSSLSNQLTIEGANATVTGSVLTAGFGAVNVTISGGGTGGTLTTNSLSQAGTLTVGSGGTLNVKIDQVTAPVVDATGNANFAANSHLNLSFGALPPVSANITVIHSDTSLAFADFNNTVSQTFAVPFLFTGALNYDGTNNLYFNLNRKTATEIGLTGAGAVIYEPALAAATQDSAFGAALTQLNSTAQVQSAMNQLLPTLTDATRHIAIGLTDSASGVVGVHQRDLLFPPDNNTGTNVWGQGFHDTFDRSGGGAYNAQGSGGAVGADISRSDTGHIGVAYTMYNGDVDEKNPGDASLRNDWSVVSLYMGARADNLFLNVDTEFGFGSVHGRRTITLPALTRMTTTGDWTERLVSASLATGYVFHLGGFQFAPQADIDGLWLDDGSYHENGGSGVDLNVRSRTEHSLRGFAGATAGESFDAGPLHIVPEVLAGWTREFNTTPDKINAFFISAADSPFTIAGPKPDLSTVVVGANLNAVWGQFTLGISYNARRGSTSTDQSGTAMLTARF